MMKTIKILVAAAALALMTGLCGCQLAQPESGENAGEDRLIGMYVTRDHVDLFDIEDFLNVHGAALFQGGEVSAEPGGEYAGRLYATRSAASGSDDAPDEYRFEGLEGFALFVPLVQMEFGPHYMVQASDAMCETELTVGDKTVLAGTIYVEPKEGGNMFCFNPVYQDAEGNVYLMSGNSMSSIGNSGEGEIYSHTLEWEETYTENGESRTSGTKVTVRVAVQFAPEDIEIVAMSATHNPLDRQAYAPRDVPEILVLPPETAYVVVQTRSHSPQGEPAQSMQLLEPGAESFITYLPGNGGVFRQRLVTLQWENTL